MKYRGIVFDLDQTLIDSSHTEEMRKMQMWASVINEIENFRFEPSLFEILNKLQKQKIKIGIITNSPSKYAKRIIERFKIHCDLLIGFHDVTKRKPDPEPFFKYLDFFNLHHTECLSIGDHDNDIFASKGANISTIGAKWFNKNYNFTSNPDFIANDILDLYKIINIQ